MAGVEARNMVFLLMLLFENAHALNARSERRSVFQVPLAANWFLVLAVTAAQGLHIAAMHLSGLNTVLDRGAADFLEQLADRCHSGRLADPCHGPLREPDSDTGNRP